MSRLVLHLHLNQIMLQDLCSLPDRLLLCNDLINNALDRFEACKAGDWDKAQQLVESANPNKKAADLISFDAFADDEEPLSGDGGLALPSDAAGGSSGSAMTSSGLPLDLFSSPSPTTTPALTAHSTGPSVPRQDPMAFFKNTPPSPARPGHSSMGSMGGLGGMSGMGGMGGMGGMNSSSSMQFGSMQSAPPPTGFPGYSLSPQPSTNAYTNGQQISQQPLQPSSNQSPQRPAQPPAAQKKDAFADLVNLMD